MLWNDSRSNKIGIWNSLGSWKLDKKGPSEEDTHTAAQVERGVVTWPDLRSARWEDAHRRQGRREKEEEGHKGQAQSADNVSFGLSLDSEQPTTKF